MYFDDFAEFMVEDAADDKSLPLGDALNELAVEVENDAIEDVQDGRKQR